MSELSMSNSMIKAMFESSAPKYKFGGSGSSMNDLSGENNNSSSSNKKPKKKASAKKAPGSQDQRRWCGRPGHNHLIPILTITFAEHT